MCIALLDLLQRLEPSVSGRNDFVWVGGPVEGPWLLVVFADEAIDCRLKIDDEPEDEINGRRCVKMAK